MPKYCRDCDTSKLILKESAATWICTKTGRHKTFPDTCDLSKNTAAPHPFLGTLDSYIEAARCKLLTEFQKEHKK